MKLVIGGVRGSFPVAQPEFMTYGGETTAFLLEGRGGELVLIDAGTGVREFGPRLQAASAREMLMLFTHYHLDHVTGLPSLGQIYRQEWTIRMAAPVRDGRSIEEIMPRLLHRPFWPLQLENVDSNVTYLNLPGPDSAAPLAWSGLHVSWCAVRHPGGCTAYRVDEPATGASAVIATDVEWKLSSPDERAALLRLCRSPRPAQVLVMDGHYADDDYERFRGWGHSTWQDVIAVAQDAGVARALVAHHAPDADDAALVAREHAVRAAWPAAELARERMEFELP
jgi:phosphoribosyl 1,2-cyclic phosphodiesterase